MNVMVVSGVAEIVITKYGISTIRLLGVDLLRYLAIHKLQYAALVGLELAKNILPSFLRG